MLDMDRVKALANILNERVYPGIRSDEEQFQRVKKIVEDEETMEMLAEKDDTDPFIPLTFSEAFQSKVWAAILQDNIYSRGAFASHIYHNLKLQDDAQAYHFKQDIITSSNQTIEQNVGIEVIEEIIQVRPSKSKGRIVNNLNEGDTQGVSPSLLCV